MLANPLATASSDEMRYRVADLQQKYDGMEPQMVKKPKDIVKGRFTLGDNVAAFEPSTQADTLVFVRGSGAVRVGRGTFLERNNIVKPRQPFEGRITFVNAHSGDVIALATFSTEGLGGEGSFASDPIVSPRRLHHGTFAGLDHFPEVGIRNWNPNCSAPNKNQAPWAFISPPSLVFGPDCGRSIHWAASGTAQLDRKTVRSHKIIPGTDIGDLGLHYRSHANRAQHFPSLGTVSDRIDAMYPDKLDGRIDAEFFDRNAQLWRAKQQRIMAEINGHRAAKQSYIEEGIKLLELAQRAGQLFEKQSAPEKRRLLDFVVSNSTWKDGELAAEYRQPFALLANAVSLEQTTQLAGAASTVESENWLPGVDSNHELDKILKSHNSLILQSR